MDRLRGAMIGPVRADEPESEPPLEVDERSGRAAAIHAMAIATSVSLPWLVFLDGATGKETKGAYWAPKNKTLKALSELVQNKDSITGMRQREIMDATRKVARDKNSGIITEGFKADDPLLGMTITIKNLVPGTFAGVRGDGSVTCDFRAEGLWTKHAYKRDGEFEGTPCAGFAWSDRTMSLAEPRWYAHPDTGADMVRIRMDVPQAHSTPFYYTVYLCKLAPERVAAAQRDLVAEAVRVVAGAPVASQTRRLVHVWVPQVAYETTGYDEGKMWSIEALRGVEARYASGERIGSSRRWDALHRVRMSMDYLGARVEGRMAFMERTGSAFVPPDTREPHEIHFTEPFLCVWAFGDDAFPATNVPVYAFLLNANDLAGKRQHA